MTDWSLVLGWGSPIGIGIFLCLVATMVYLFSKANEVSKRSKKEYPDKK